MSKLRVLDFDIENRPLAYWYDGQTTAEITAIAACWMGQPESMKVWLLGIHRMRRILDKFRALYDQADIVTGHFIRGHDLPILNGHMLEAGLPPLDAKMTVDTKMDLTRRKDLSASLEELVAMFGLEGEPCAECGARQGKLHLSNHAWREANRLKRAGIADAKRRATSDVRLHMALYARLVEGGYLGAPKVWRP